MTVLKSFSDSGCVYNSITYSIIKISKGRNKFISEYIASRFIKALQGNAQEVNLNLDKNILSLEIKGFLPKGMSSADSLKFETLNRINNNLGERGYKSYTLRNVYRTISSLNASNSNKTEIKEQFWDMLIFDAILGNTPRMDTDFGYFVDDIGCYYDAPIFSNDSCLKIQDKWKNSDVEEKRVLALKNLVAVDSSFTPEVDEDWCRVDYKSIIEASAYDAVFKERLERISKSYTAKDIGGIIFRIVDSIDFLENWEKEYYIYIVVLRYACFIQNRSFSEIWNSVKDYL